MRANDRDNPVITRRRLVLVIIWRRFRNTDPLLHTRFVIVSNYAGIIYPSGRKIWSFGFSPLEKTFRFGESLVGHARPTNCRARDGSFFYSSSSPKRRTRAKTGPTARIDFQIRNSSIGLLLALPPSPCPPPPHYLTRANAVRDLFHNWKSFNRARDTLVWRRV